MLLRTRIDLDNHIRGVLKAFGLKVGKVATGQFEARVWELIDEGDAQIRWVVGTLLTTRAAVSCSPQSNLCCSELRAARRAFRLTKGSRSSLVRAGRAHSVRL
jgi:hypothetical protein